MRHHGGDTRGLEAGAMPGLGFGRFGTMFDLPAARRLPEDALRDLATAMIKIDPGAPITEREAADENPTIPAGYTYFGQFIDHDLTFDPTPLSEREVDVAALEDFRTPALDLDCVYGGGPDNQPYLYTAATAAGQTANLRLRTGAPLSSPDALVGSRRDLLRLAADPSPSDAIAVIGDKRNDENKIVSQIQGMFIAFHNKVVEDEALVARGGGDVSDPTSWFRAASSIVRWHYQWVVVHDFLERILQPGTLAEVLNFRGNMPLLLHYKRERARYPYIPVEFAGAAYRFGHSMVRPGYALNAVVGTGSETPVRIPTFSNDPDPRRNLNGFPATPPEGWGIDWGFFLDLPTVVNPAFVLPQPAYRIDALLSEPLSELPEFAGAQPRWLANLAFRNLQRGQMLSLPSGQAVARHLGIEPLSDDVLWSAGSRLRDPAHTPEEFAKDLDETDEKRKQVRAKWGSGPTSLLEGNAPLWYYILREAEYYGVLKNADDEGIAFGGQHLGPVGSRIVAETFIGLLWYDPTSFLHCRPGFRPYPPIAGSNNGLTLPELVRYALS